MKKNCLITFLTASTMLLTAVSANVFAETGDEAEKYHTVTFLDYDGEILDSFKVRDGEKIDYSLIDTDSDTRLNRHLDIYTEQVFSSWNIAPDTAEKDITIKALSKTAVISQENLPEKTMYFSNSGEISLDGLKVTITITTQLPAENDDGYTEESLTVDVSSSCTASPSTLEEAFKDGDSSVIEIFPVGQNKAIASYNIGLFKGLGDVDGNGSVDVSDATQVLRSYTLLLSDESYALPENIQKYGDINFDGRIDSIDASLILRFYTLVMSDTGITLDEFLDMHEIKPIVE